ncbi:MAG: nitroreductase family protein [archaeon]|nr:nitroreductase family protein [archaeon]
MNDIIRAMIERRSVRKYTAQIPDRELVDQIIEAGLYAANGRGYQHTKIIILEDPVVREEIRKHNAAFGGWPEDFDPFYGAPVRILVIARRDWYNRQYDGALVMGNMMLAAHALGLGSCWINRAREEFETEYGRELLRRIGIEDEWEGIGYCAIGHPTEPLPSPPARKEDRVHRL